MNIRFKITLTVFLVYLFYIAPDYITANTNRYIALTKSIVEDKTFKINKYYQYTRDVAPIGDDYYMGAAPGLSFMAIPLYAILKPLMNIMPEQLYQDVGLNILNLFFTFFLSILPGVAISILLYDLLNEFNLKEKEKLLITFGLSFGTILFYYSTRFMAPVSGAFMLFSAFYILFKSKDLPEKKYHAFLVAILLGMAVLIDYILAIGALFISLYYFLNFRRKGILYHLFFILGVSVAALVYMHYHYICFGNPFAMATAYSRMIGRNAISLPKPRVMLALALGTYRGLFIYMPVLLLSIYGLAVFFRKPEKKYLQEMVFISLFSISIYLVISGYTAWDGGGDFGPRYFVSFLPFLIIPIVFAFRRIGYRIAFWITAVSIFINWCGVQYGDSDNVFTNIGLFIFQGLNSDLTQLSYRLITTYVRKLNVITHFSPLIPFIMLISFLYAIWKDELKTSRSI